MMRSPTLNPLASGPTAITSPANSLPIGRPVEAPWLVSPFAEPRSARLRPIALTFTVMSAAFGVGGGMSLMTIPFGDATPAFMIVLPRMRQRHANALSPEEAAGLRHYHYIPNINSSGRPA